MIQIKNILISEEVISEDFVCNLSACKGACCVQGDEGAPLELEELSKLEEVFHKVKAHMRPEAVEIVENQGAYVRGAEGDFLTPLVGEKGPCVYAFFQKDGRAKCAIEKSHEKGEISFKKPISCHLYPLRIEKFSKFTMVNYHRWDICSAACRLGAELSVSVYKFLKEPLIRKFGESWYKKLHLYAYSKNKPK